MNSNEIKREINSFQASVHTLSEAIGNAGVLWADAKYSELFSSVSAVANQSKDVIISGDKSCVSINKFAKIAEEKY